MPIYRYTGLQRGKKCEGFLSAATKNELTSNLRRQDIRLVSMKEYEREADSSFEEVGTRSAWERRLSRFTVTKGEAERMLSQLSSLLQAGVPILKALRLTARLASSNAIRRSLYACATRLSGGGALHEQLREEAPYLDNATLSLIAIGETNGTLQEMLRYAANLMNRRRKVKGDLLQALSYPVMVMLAAGGAGWFMMEKVIPKIMGFLKNRGVALPSITQNLINTVDFLNAYGLLILGGIAALIVGIAFSRRTPALARLEDRAVLRVPFFGKLMAAASNALWSRTLGVLLHSGINVMAALTLTANTLPNRYIRQQFDWIRELIRQGFPLSDSTRLTDLNRICPLAEPMLKIGENTGLIDQNLEQIALFYEEEMERRLKTLGKMIEPALFVVVGGMVAFVYIGFFLGLMALSKRGG